MKPRGRAAAPELSLGLALTALLGLLAIAPGGCESRTAGGRPQPGDDAADDGDAGGDGRERADAGDDADAARPEADGSSALDGRGADGAGDVAASDASGDDADDLDGGAPDGGALDGGALDAGVDARVREAAAVQPDATVIDGAASGDAGSSDRGGALDGATGPDAVTPPRDGGKSCSDLPGGCLCTAGAPSGGACSAASVKSAAGNEGSVCCDSGLLCRCLALACKSAPAQSLCTCGNSALLDANAPGTRVAACPAPSGAGRCCVSADLTQCVCVPFECDAGETRVPGCSPAVLAVCSAEEQAVPVCN